ncbi:MAG: glutamine amidotransferase [Planctomycetes bacterium]|nr:glutamine amidotransferase [Planctomycetota bacterium]
MATLADITFDNFDPPWLWIGVAVVSLGVLGWTYLGMYRRSGRSMAIGLFTLRAAGVLALMVSLVKPGWTRTEEHTQKTRLAVVLDDSQSMWLSAPGGEGVSRYELARRLVTDSDFATALRRRFDISLFNINGEPIPPGKLPSEPTAEQTDLLRALRSASSRLRGRSAAGILLVSDGRDTSGRESYLAAQDLVTSVYTVGFRVTSPSAGAPFDLAVTAVDAPQRAMVHNTVRVRVVVSKDTGAAIEPPVQIELAGSVVAAGKVSLPQGAAQRVVELSFTPTQPGDFSFAAHVPEQPGERTGGNNSVSFRLRVEAEPIRVLYVEGYLRPEYTFLRDRLSSDPDIDLVTLVRSASPDQLGATSALAGAELLTPERLKKIDVILLGDLEATMLDETAFRALRDWVSDGGAMMILGGYHNLSPAGLPATLLSAALPVEPATGAATQIDEPFQFQLTPEGRSHPAMFLTGDLSRDTAAWESLPRLAGVVAVAKTKPGAMVLARHPTASSDDPDHKGYPVLITQGFGKGTVALITADTTWKWSRYTRLTGQPDTMYVRFWSQMVRWLARRDVLTQRPALRVTTDAASYPRGKQVAFEVRRNPAGMVPGTDKLPASPSLTVRTPDGRSVPVQLSQTADPDAWTASYFPDRGGRFTAEARLAAPALEDAPPRDLASDTTEFLVQGSPLELDDPSTNPASLSQIASLTGGVSAAINDESSIRALLDALPDRAWTSFETRRAGVWNSPFLFLLFLACVCVEWVVRRKHQLI